MNGCGDAHEPKDMAFKSTRRIYGARVLTCTRVNAPAHACEKKIRANAVGARSTSYFPKIAILATQIQESV